MEQEKRNSYKAPRRLRAILLRREKVSMKWLVRCVKCLDFILKVSALGLVFG